MDALGLTTSNASPPHHSIDLPQLLPLSHSHPLLSSNSWDVDTFLLSRSNLSLQDLRSELRSYLADLKEELVQLINDDYAAFISLSTDLKGEGERLVRVQKPLGGLRAEIEKSREELANVQLAVQHKLDERAALREEKALLHLLLKLSDSVARLESLLLISSSSEQTASVDFSSLGIRGINGLSVTQGEDDVRDDRSRGGQAKHLARVATEYTQLLYHAEKGRDEGCAFVNEVQWRIDRIKLTLSRDLDHLFSESLTSLTSSTIEAASVTDKARWTSDLTECLRTYDLLGGWRDAEEVVRRDLVRPFVKNTIFSGALAVAPSPILVRTSHIASSTSSNTLLSPVPPFTPFTARGNPFDALSLTTTGLTLLDEGEGEPDALASLFNTVLRFVQVNCTGVLQLSEKISAKSRGKRARGVNLLGHAGNGNASVDDSLLGVDDDGFSITANVVWAEVGRAVMEELGGVVFSVGNPDEFHRNYTTTNAFISSLEHLAPSLHAVECMREHPIYVAFQRRWQLNVYFQLRWKEIVGRLEDVLLSSSSSGEKEDGFVTAQASATLAAIRTCWARGVYIPELGGRFWRLTLQIISRYRSYLESTLPAFEEPPIEQPPQQEPTTTTSGFTSSRSIAHMDDTSNNVPAATDELNLRRFAGAYVDVACLEKKIWALWKHEIGILLVSEGGRATSRGTTDEVDKDKTPEDVLKLTLSAHLTSLLPLLTQQIVLILIRRCSEPLAQVSKIPTQYMNTKASPTGPSAFVGVVLKPLRAFLEESGKEVGGEWKGEVFDVVSSRYTTHLTQMQKIVESVRRLRKGTTMFSLPLFSSSSSSSSTSNTDDGERIKTQVKMDVDALGEDARRLGVDVDASEGYKVLRRVASE